MLPVALTPAASPAELEAIQAATAASIAVAWPDRTADLTRFAPALRDRFAALPLAEFQALGVHRATAARWITAARDGVAERTRALLQAQLGVGASTLRQLGQLVESGLELSIGRLLAAP